MTGPASMRFERVGYGYPDAVRLIAQVQAEYVVRYGSPDETPVEPAMFEPPAGSFFVGYLGDEPVATGAWRRSSLTRLDSDAVAEIKRMYVVPGARGAGLARTVLAHLEADAAAYGFEVLVLETGTAQPEAMALYESAGYVAVPGFGHYQDSPLSRTYGKWVGKRTEGVPGRPGGG